MQGAARRACVVLQAAAECHGRGDLAGVAAILDAVLSVPVAAAGAWRLVQQQHPKHHRYGLRQRANRLKNEQINPFFHIFLQETHTIGFIRKV